MPQKIRLFLTFLTGILLSQPFLAHAGCGCDKPPPELSAVRPNATYAGMDVTLTHPSVQSSLSYDVTFTSGITGESATVTAVAVTQRDLADSQEKPQLVVTVPALPLGPTSISVRLSGQTPVVMAAPDEVFTVAPQPLTFSETIGEAIVPAYQAAVSRSGVVYISLDVTDMQMPRTFTAQALGYPLRFTNNDVVFTNTQGFLMQLLEEGMPGLFAIDAASGSPDSDTLQYSRHEFNTYFLHHDERQAHNVDPTDPHWHLDGSPHIDHDHLIVAISGMLDDGSTPAPGVTPAFDLALSTYTLFHHGLVGDAAVTLTNQAFTDSYNSTTGLSGSHGDVRSNGTIRLTNTSVIDGDATGFGFALSNGSVITGEMSQATEPTELLMVDLPPALENLGSLQLTNGAISSLGPGSYRLSKLEVVNNGILSIDNTLGPVTLYVTGDVTIDNGGRIFTSDPDPEKFALYVVGSHTVKFSNTGTLHGVVYAPEAEIEVDNGAQSFGSFVGNEIHLANGAAVHYDTALRGE